MAILLDGKKIADRIQDDLKKEVLSLEKKYRRRPALGCLTTGDNPAASVYCKAQAKVAGDIGIDYRTVALPKDAEEKDLIAAITRCNNDPDIDGFMVQTPLPQGMCRGTAAGFIAPAKDVEGMHPQHLGRLMLGDGDGVVPCTARACMELLKETGLKLYGKEAVVVGHSEIVGKPISLLLLREFVTTTVCHIATFEAHRLPGHVADADILISAVGKPHLIKGAWIKEGAVVLDVGISRVADRIAGDVEFDAASVRASYITPVPGGVGPVTVMMLMKNLIALYKKRNDILR